MEALPLDITFSGYEELQDGEIRLLHLQPPRPHGNEDQGKDHRPAESGELECFFSIAALSGLPPFEALSYAWGDPRETVSIRLNGSQASITKNLNTVLLHLRLEDSPRVLWVDALCINQLDPSERRHQVSCMRDIYERATSVLIFLGLQFPGHDMAISFLQQAAQTNHHYDPRQTPHLSVNGLTGGDVELRESIISFFTTPWWSRTWVVQEYVLAARATFQIGPATISADVVQAAFENLRHHHGRCCAGDTSILLPHPPAGLSLLDAIKSFDGMVSLRPYQHMHPLLETVGTFRMKEATDARDKIYGVLGMRLDREIGEVIPDYEVPAEEVYKRFALQHIRETGTLDVLYHAQYGKRRMSLPSWVPDWTAGFGATEHTRYLTRLDTLSYYYDASGGRKASMEYFDDGQGKIALTGVLIGTIASLGSSYDVEIERLSLIEESTTILRQHKATLDHGHGRVSHSKDSDGTLEKAGDLWTEESDDRLWKTLCGNQIADWADGVPGMRHLQPEQDFAAYRAWRAWLSQTTSTEPQPGNGVEDFDAAFKMTTWGRRFVVSDSGLTGFVPDSCQKGDIIVILHGSRTPFVLRELTDTPRTAPSYQLIGDVYIHGIMNGEEVSLSSAEIVYIIR